MRFFFEWYGCVFWHALQDKLLFLNNFFVQSPKYLFFMWHCQEFEKGEGVLSTDRSFTKKKKLRSDHLVVGGQGEGCTHTHTHTHTHTLSLSPSLSFLNCYLKLVRVPPHPRFTAGRVASIGIYLVMGSPPRVNRGVACGWKWCFPAVSEIIFRSALRKVPGLRAVAADLLTFQLAGTSGVRPLIVWGLGLLHAMFLRPHCALSTMDFFASPPGFS